MKLVLLGVPGSGKGTYSSRLSEKLNIPHISSGDLFREAIKNETPLGKEAKKYSEKGQLVPDKLTIEVVKERLERADCKDGFILDGFPRTIYQADALNEFTKIDIIINLKIPRDILIEKMLARRVCKQCGELYNIANINREGVRLPPVLPKVKGKCDKCGGELYQRKDDNAVVITGRFDIYEKQTAPLINYYTKKGLLKEFKVTGPPNEMISKLLKIIK